MKDRKLTTKQQLFVEAYIGKANGNATEAARLAGYKGNDVTLAAVGAENLKKPHIAEFCHKRVETAGMTANEVVSELTKLARSEGRHQIKALELLGKYHALFTDRKEHTGNLEHRVIKPSTSTIIIQGVKGDND